MQDPNETPSPLAYRSGEADVQDQKRLRRALLSRLNRSAEVPAGLLCVAALIAIPLTTVIGDPLRVGAILLVHVLAVWYIIARNMWERPTRLRLLRSVTFAIGFLLILWLLQADAFQYGLTRIRRYGINARQDSDSLLALIGFAVVASILIVLECVSLVERYRVRRRRRRRTRSRKAN